MGNCETCCQGQNDKNNVDLDPAKAIKVQGGFEDRTEGAEGLDLDVSKIPVFKMKMIIKLQAFWRGHQARRIMTLLRAK